MDMQSNTIFIACNYSPMPWLQWPFSSTAVEFRTLIDNYKPSLIMWMLLFVRVLIVMRFDDITVSKMEPKRDNIICFHIHIALLYTYRQNYEVPPRWAPEGRNC